MTGTTLVRAGWMVPMGPGESVVHDAAVLLRGRHIVATGGAAEVVQENPQECAAAEVVDLKDHVLLPGLVNLHTHLAMVMFRGLADDRDLDAFLATVVPAEERLLSAATVEVASRAAALESVQAGVTTALDMYFFPDATLAAAHDVGLRVINGPVVLDAAGPEGRDREERLDWAAAWLADHPVSDVWRPALGPHATYTVAPEHLAAVADLAARHDALVHIHAAETLGELELVTRLHGAHPVEVIDRAGALGERTVLAHGVHLGPHIVDVVARGAAVAHCPASNLKLASGVAPVPQLVELGVTVGLGTDGAASSNDLDVHHAARLAALLHKGTSGDAAVLPAHAVLEAATLGGARALGLDAALGSLEAGKVADIVAFDLSGVHTQPVHDVCSAVLHAATRGDVSDVWVEGRRVVADATVQGVDHVAVVAELRELGELVRAVASGGGGGR